MLQTVRIEGQPQLAFEPVGGWDTGRFSLERDLIEAVKKGRVAIVHAFLAKGASADARDERGGTALHWAVARGRPDVVELLLAHGSDAGVQDASGCGAIEPAERRELREIAEALRKRLQKRCSARTARMRRHCHIQLFFYYDIKARARLAARDPVQRADGAAASGSAAGGYRKGACADRRNIAAFRRPPAGAFK